MHQIVAETSSLWPRWSVDAVQTRLFESPKLSATLLVIWLSIFLRMIFACHHEIQGLKQALWFAMESWPQSLFSGAVTFNLSERRALLRRWSRSSWLSLLEWVGWFTLLPMCTVKYESYLAWFFIYASSGWQGFGFEGEEEEAAKEEQRSRFGRS